MRGAAWILAGASAVFGCALGYAYDGYERTADARPDAGGASGGSAGVGGAAGAAGSTGGSAGAPGCVNDDGCLPDSECADWTCTSGQCAVTSPPAGTPCGLPPTCSGQELERSTCQDTMCVKAEKNCLAKCSTAGCCSTCVDRFYTPQILDPLCPSDSQTSWSSLVTCCTSHCATSCMNPSLVPFLVCGGTITEQIVAPCLDCLNVECSGQLTSCSADIVE